MIREVIYHNIKNQKNTLSSMDDGSLIPNTVVGPTEDMLNDLEDKLNEGGKNIVFLAERIKTFRTA